MRIIVIEDNELYKNELLQCLEQEESDIEIVGSASNGARQDFYEEIMLEAARQDKQR